MVARLKFLTNVSQKTAINLPYLNDTLESKLDSQCISQSNSRRHHIIESSLTESSVSDL